METLFSWIRPKQQEDVNDRQKSLKEMANSQSGALPFWHRPSLPFFILVSASKLILLTWRQWRYPYKSSGHLPVGHSHSGQKDEAQCREEPRRAIFNSSSDRTRPFLPLVNVFRQPNCEFHGWLLEALCYRKHDFCSYSKLMSWRTGTWRLLWKGLQVKILLCAPSKQDKKHQPMTQTVPTIISSSSSSKHF